MPPAGVSDAAMTFDYFETGMELGSRTIAVAPLIAEWDMLFPGAAGAATVPIGLLVTIMMRGYLSLLDRRPPGNVHAGQRLRWGPPVDRAAELVVGVRCAAKELRGERLWLTFVTTVRGADGATHLEGEMRSLWAA